MWQVYQYGHGKVKLTKDLKTADSNLRVSLIEKEEIENMARVLVSLIKIYDQRKNYYKIDPQSFTTPAYQEQVNEEEATNHLSYKEKVDLYRKRVQNEKLESKYNSLFKKTEKRRHKMRNPVLYKLLHQFQEEYKHDQNLQIRQDLKESENNLQMIKINTHRKARFNLPSEEGRNQSRPRFISLENGLPEKEVQNLPKWIDYLQGKMAKPAKTNSNINIQQLQSTFDSIIGKQQVKAKRVRKPSKQQGFHRDIHSPFKDQFSKGPSPPQQPLKEVHQKQIKENSFFCQRCEKQEPQKKKEENRDQLHLHRNFSNKHEGRKTMNKTFKGARTNPVKPEQNVSVQAERTFSKSQNYSKNVISTMQNFYQTKNHKKVDYQKMVFYLKKDRPLTSDIRRNNYRVISTENIKQIKNYRSMSEKERLKLKNVSCQFYLSLLKQLERYNVEEMHLSGKIMERLRDVLSSNYSIANKHFEYIAEPALYETRDQMSETILDQIEDYIERHK